jgi:acyl-CoA synthetase (AMP-forming)/AMP-acid ligase II
MIGDRIETNIAGGLEFPIPRMVEVRQKFTTTKLDDITGAVNDQFKRAETKGKVKPGMRVAVGCGSRGIANIAEAAKAVVDNLKALGAKPFIFPAMGSHGGATSEGQRGVLEGYGITEATMGCPVKSEMDVVEVGKLPDGMPVYQDKNANGADGVVLVCRVKPHTNFRAPIESGIVKMMTIGMGKIIGASTLHSNGMDTFATLLPDAARLIVSKINFMFGVALLENAHDETAMIEAVAAETLFTREAELQAIAKQMMPRIKFDEVDVLIVEQIGKNISGAGMDPNITGRNSRQADWNVKPDVKKIVVLGLTPETHGNACGMGSADVITMRLYKEIDIGVTYANIITSTYLDGGAIPLIMNTDHDAIHLACKSVVRIKPADLKIVRILDTLHVSQIQISEALYREALKSPNDFDILGALEPLRFDARARLVPMNHTLDKRAVA